MEQNVKTDNTIQKKSTTMPYI